jgi:hypothetical protein
MIHHIYISVAAARNPLGELSCKLTFQYFSKVCGKNQVPLTSDKHVGYFIKVAHEVVKIFRQFFLK